MIARGPGDAEMAHSDIVPTAQSAQRPDSSHENNPKLENDAQSHRTQEPGNHL
jgi:hypothetical protein